MKNLINDHRVRVTRMLLRKAFLELLSQKPIQSISVRELCETAGINRGTFYAHYKDIYDLREQIESEMLSDFQKALEPLLGEKTARVTPTDITAGIFRCLKDNSDICAATLGKYGDRDFLAHLIDLGRDSCIKGYTEYFRSASFQEIELFYSFVSAGCIALLQNWIDRGMTEPAENIAAAAEEIMMKGIGFLEK
ncbi:MAG: TetR/AcrR family transcriptional regulator [Clostridia bacterium]